MFWWQSYYLYENGTRISDEINVADMSKWKKTFQRKQYIKNLKA